METAKAFIEEGLKNGALPLCLSAIRLLKFVKFSPPLI